jgi:hypothetical protein
MLAFSAFIPRDPFYQLTIALCFVGILVATVFVFASRPKSKGQPVSTLEAYLKFIYGCFLKPYTGDGSGSQQDALVGFECVEIYELRLNFSRRAFTKHRLMSTMPPGFDFFVAVRTCWVWSQHN